MDRDCFSTHASLDLFDIVLERNLVISKKEYFFWEYFFLWLFLKTLGLETFGHKMYAIASVTFVNLVRPMIITTLSHWESTFVYNTIDMTAHCAGSSVATETF